MRYAFLPEDERPLVKDAPIIPDHRIIRELPRGGMSRVFLAIQAGFDREVAVKVMSRSLDDIEKMERRFLHEARTVARLVHRNIVSVYHVRKTADATYMTMEYLPGGSLKTRLNGGVHLAEVLSIVTQMAGALQFAHDNGVIHRDVKPDNILFRGDGTPVLTDFGIARQDDSDARMTQAGFQVGTPSYMSPEQIDTEQVGVKDIDGRSDLYSLGVVLYEMLMSRVPFGGDTPMAVMIKHLTEQPAPLARAVADFQPILDRMLAKKPAARFESCEEFVSSLKELVEDVPSLWSRVQTVPDRRILENLRQLGFVGDSGATDGRRADSAFDKTGRTDQPTRAVDRVGTSGARRFRDGEVSSAQISALLASPGFSVEDAEVAAEHVQAHLTSGTGFELKFQLLGKLAAIVSQADDLDRTGEARKVIDAVVARIPTLPELMELGENLQRREAALTEVKARRERSDRAFARAHEALRAKRLLPPEPENALELLQQALTEDPSREDARRLLEQLPGAIHALASALAAQQEFDEAVRIVHSAAEAFPSDGALAELRDHIAREKRRDAERRERERALQRLAEEFLKAPLASAPLAIECLLELGDEGLRHPAATLLLSEVNYWLMGVARAGSGDEVEDAFSVLQGKADDLKSNAAMAPAWCSLEARRSQLVAERERRESVDRGLAQIRTLVADGQLLASGGETLWESMRRLTGLGASGQLLEIFQGDVLDSAVRNALAKQHVDDVALERWVGTFSALLPDEAISGQLSAMVVLARRDRENAERIDRLSSRVSEADLPVEALRQLLDEVVSIDASPSLKPAHLELAQAAVGRLGQRLTGASSRAEVEALVPLKAVVELLAERLDPSLNLAERAFDQAFHRVSVVEVEARLRSSIAGFEAEPSPAAFVTMRDATSGSGVLPEWFEDAWARGKFIAESRALSATKARDWAQAQAWERALEGVLPRHRLLKMVGEREAAMASAAAADAQARQDVEAFGAQLRMDGFDVAGLVHALSSLREIQARHGAGLARPCAEELAQRASAMVIQPSDVAAFQAFAEDWASAPPCGVSDRGLRQLLRANDAASGRSEPERLGGAGGASLMETVEFHALRESSEGSGVAPDAVDGASETLAIGPTVSNAAPTQAVPSLRFEETVAIDSAALRPEPAIAATDNAVAADAPAPVASKASPPAVPISAPAVSPNASKKSAVPAVAIAAAVALVVGLLWWSMAPTSDPVEKPSSEPVTSLDPPSPVVAPPDRPEAEVPRDDDGLARLRAAPPPAAVTGVLVVDARPWGEVVEVRGPDGTPLALPVDRSTPLRLAVPLGTYRIRIRHPDAPTAAVVNAEVTANGIATAQARFEVINVDRLLEEGGR